MAASVVVFAVALLSSVAAVSGVTNFGSLSEELLRKGYKNIVDILGNTRVADELKAYLDAGNNATLFLPRDNYLQKAVDPVTVEFLKNNTEELIKVLRFHVVPGKRLLRSDLRGVYETLEGETIQISTRDRRFFVEKSPIRQPNAVVLENVVVHGINGLLIPPKLTGDLPVSPSRPPKTPSSPAPAPSPSVPAPAPSPGAGNEILDALRRASYDTLVELITGLGLAGYVDSLQPPFTILAPNDAALNNASLTAQQALTQNVSVVTAVLNNHIIPGQYILYDFLVAKSIQYPNEAGSTVYFESTGASSVNVGLTNNSDIQIVTQRILANDERRISVMGIDGVILPPTVVPRPQSTGFQSTPSLLLSLACGFALFALL